ncbi:MAG: type IV secretory system conjugative DNA transfer family protein [Clostridia bacterium]|nr:type IV secretory system conjugative DNA transfer family protein [Clostridia bacterium]
MSIELIIILALLLLFIIGFIFIEPLVSKHKIKNKNEYGSARFSTIQEIKNNFKKEKISCIKEAGVPIWFSKDLSYVWFDKETPHYVYLGSTGSGKSVTAVIPECSFIATAKIKRSVFITDPKGEIFNTTSKMFKDNNYNVLTLDFRHPELSNHFNILEPIIKEYEKYVEYEKKSKESTGDNEKVEFNNKAMSSFAETNRLITSLSTIIMQEKSQQKDPFWNNSAKNLLEGLIGFFLEEYKSGNISRNKITMTSIRKFQNSSMQEKNFNKFKLYIERKDYGTKSKDSLTSILSASENTYKSITAVFGEKMALFDDINVANVTSNTDFDFDLLGKEPTALFVIVPDEDKTYFTLVTIVVGLLYRELVKLANLQNNKKLPVQIDWILDEFANCPPLSDIEAIVSVARSRGMRFHFFIQSFAQLDNVYGKDVSQIILDNCGLIYLKTNTQDTAEAISKRLGKQTIESNSISQSMSIMDYKGNKSTSLIARDLLTPDEVKQLHYKTIIFPIIGYPIFRDTILYNKFSCYKSGEIDRNINSLKQLDSTYFTVEQIKSNLGNRFRKVEDNDIDKDAKDFYKEQKDYEEETLIKAIEQIQHILKQKELNFEYKTINNKTYSVVTLDNKLTAINQSLIKGQIDNNIYHVEIDSNKDGKQVIEIHLKNILDRELESPKGRN